jgi:myosin-1
MAMQTSELSVVKALFPENEERSSKRPVTVATQFKTAVNELVKTLLSATPHYVRCIKSNHKKQGFYFDEQCIRHQVRYLGCVTLYIMQITFNRLVENVRVRRAGFADRHTYVRFLNRYKMLCKETWPLWKGDTKTGVEKILKEHKISAEEFRMGKTKVFIRNPKTVRLLFSCVYN